MIKINKTKKHELKDKLVKHLKEQGRDTELMIILNPTKHENNVLIRGGKINKDGSISEKFHQDTFYSGETYYFQGFGGKNNIQVVIRNYPSNERSRVTDWGSYIYLDIDEVFLPTERQDDTELSSLYDYNNDEVVIEIECPKTITMSLDSIKRNYIDHWGHPVNRTTPFTDYEIECWKSSLDQFGKDFDIKQSVEELVVKEIKQRYRSFIIEQKDVVHRERHNESEVK